MSVLELKMPLGTVLRGALALPGSKSISNRLLVMRALAGENTLLPGLSTADDTLLMQAALASSSTNKFAGPAGTVMRFLLPYLCLQQGEFRLSGSDRAHERPIAPLVNALKQLGARIDYLDKPGHPPLWVRGGALQGGKLQIEANISSQYISALLLVGPYLPGGLQLELQGPAVSKPYIQQTIQLMQAWGAQLQWHENTLTVAPQAYQAPASFYVEPDWSAAAYWLAFAALVPATDLLLSHLKLQTEQADRQAAEWFGALGCGLEQRPDGLRLQHQPASDAALAVYNGQDCPDLMPTLIVLCAIQGHLARFEGLASLRLKESDRIEALRINLEAAGVKVRVEDDVLQLESGVPAGPAKVQIQCFHDHRMAMAFSLLAAAEKTVIFDQPKVVEKSYPDFWQHLAGFGFELM
ncbi:MAG: 3-phosphoshikimate 1-carboxyvinyltransferase [Sphingobacteriaceae bacterium]|nr:3-phosphoshikimate 1-carboxyvinyltransferase [Sphingobacteriaceae bacterium]